VNFIKPTKHFSLYNQNAGVKAALLKNSLVIYNPELTISDKTSQESVAKQALFFNVRKVRHAFHFEQFMGANKYTAKAIKDVSLDLYSQYIANLQDAKSIVNVETSGDTSVRAARALRKYITLLRKYFQEVHDNKMAKKVPASSAMY